jgi:hypothetical protein
MTTISFPFDPYVGQVYLASNGITYTWDGTKWLGQGLLGGTTSGGSPSGPYELPIATNSTLGGVRIGDNISVDAGGKISVVAPFSGNYNDLTNKPTVPPAQIQSDWTQTDNTRRDYIKNKPQLFSGNYGDLYDRPQLFSGNYNDLTGKPTLARVANTGNYSDLNNKPTIPTDISQLADNTHILQRATNYTLPAATTSILGGVKVGDGLDVDGDGVLSVVLDYHSLQNKPMTAGHTPPSNNVVREGDLWWNTQDGNLYIRYRSTWVVTITTTKGDPGTTGPPGAQGVQGPQGIRGNPGQIASRSQLGVVKIGDGINVTAGGTISTQRINRVIDIPDVNGTGLTDGSVLVYNTILSRWDNTVNLNQENMDGGHF